VEKGRTPGPPECTTHLSISSEEGERQILRTVLFEIAVMPNIQISEHKDQNYVPSKM